MYRIRIEAKDRMTNWPCEYSSCKVGSGLGHILPFASLTKRNFVMAYIEYERWDMGIGCDWYGMVKNIKDDFRFLSR